VDSHLLTLHAAWRAPAAADGALDEAPRALDGPIITPTVAKSILGQAALQLGVMAALLGPLGEALVQHASSAAAAEAAVAAAAVGAMTAVGGAVGDVAARELAGGLSPERAMQYTLVFNSFVLMQLFNQVRGVGRAQAALLAQPVCCQQLCACMYAKCNLSSTCFGAWLQNVWFSADLICLSA
jgi:hypothetical protein